MKVEEIIEEQVMLEMANFYPDDTGIGYVMWFGEVGGQHGPRIKVSNRPGRFAIDSNFTLTVSKTPKVETPDNSVGIKQRELNRIKRWVQINYDTLMLLWQIHETGNNIQMPNGEILNVTTILNQLKRV